MVDIILRGQGGKESESIEEMSMERVLSLLSLTKKEREDILRFLSLTENEKKKILSEILPFVAKGIGLFRDQKAYYAFLLRTIAEQEWVSEKDREKILSSSESMWDYLSRGVDDPC